MSPAGALSGVRVIDAATLLAGPLIATHMADFGAEVIKVEHPRGDALRSFGWNKDGTSAFWKTASRNKRCCTLNLSRPEGQEIMRRLTREADVLIENFRPGTMERWNLGYEQLSRENPRLVMVRVTGFGQDGPYSARPGFGTLAEAMSGLASVLGESDRPPIVPPIPMADQITGLHGAFATMAALYSRDVEDEGAGQCIDLNLFESMVAFMAPQVTAFDMLGVVPRREGSQTEFSAPRGVYRTADGRWLAISTSTQSVADRLFAAIGWPELAQDPRFATSWERVANRTEIDGLVAEWVAAREHQEALAILQENDVAASIVYSVADVVEDEHLRVRQTLARVPDAAEGAVLMHSALPRMSRTPGEVREAGRALGADNEQIYEELLGFDRARLDDLRARGVI